MEERVSHIVNGIEYLPYGEPNFSNIALYDKFINTLNPVQQHYWITEFYRGFVDQNAMSTVNIPIAARQVMLNITYGNYFKPTGVRVCMLTIKQKGEEDYLECNHVFYTVFNDSIEDNDYFHIAEWISAKEGITEKYGKHVYNMIWMEIDLAVKHYLYHGESVGYYQDYDDLAANYLDNKFIVITPRQAFIDNNIQL